MHDAVLVAGGERAEHAADHRRGGRFREWGPAFAHAVHAGGVGIGCEFLVVVFVVFWNDGVVLIFGGVRDGRAGEQVPAVAEVYEQVYAGLVLEPVV